MQKHTKFHIHVMSHRNTQHYFFKLYIHQTTWILFAPLATDAAAIATARHNIGNSTASIPLITPFFHFNLPFSSDKIRGGCKLQTLAPYYESVFVQPRSGYWMR